MPPEKPNSKLATRPDTPDEVLLTRTEAARRMGVSVSTVRRMEHSALTPIVVQGKHLFRCEEVDRYTAKGEGEIAARAFALFEAGKSPVDAVILLEQVPERIQQLHEEWAKLSCRIAADAPSGGLARFLRDEFEGSLTPRALTAAMRMLYLDEDLRARWHLYMNDGAQAAQQESTHEQLTQEAPTDVDPEPNAT